MEVEMNAYLKVCDKCLQIYGCKIEGEHFSIERHCKTCIDYYNNSCQVVKVADWKLLGECIPCANKEEKI